LDAHGASWEEPGRPLVSEEIRELIRKVSGANPLRGTPHFVGELGKLGIKVAKSTVDKYRVRSAKTPSPTWKTFLKNHVNDLVSTDFFIVRTIRFKLPFVLVVLAHSRRKFCTLTSLSIRRLNGQRSRSLKPSHGTARHSISSEIAMRSTLAFQQRIRGMGIEQILTSPRSSWQNPFAECLIGTLRRDCLDHVVVLSDRHRRRIVGRYLDYCATGEHTLPYRWTHRTRGRCIRRTGAGWSHFWNSAACVITTNDWRRDPASTAMACIGAQRFFGKNSCLSGAAHSCRKVVRVDRAWL
jgi:transposase InsO family protein